MEFACPKNQLQNAIHHAERSISSRNTLPVLSNLLFEVNSDILKVSGTDMEIGIEKKVKVDSAQQGSVLINSKTISGIVNKLPDANVTLKVLDNNVIEIKCEQVNFTIHGLPSEEFPQIPKIKDGSSIKVNKDIFKELIKQTIISVSIDESKHILNGVMVEFNNDSITGVATDGYRLSLKETKGKYEINDKIQMIIPTKALNELATIFSDNDDQDIKVNFSDSLASFTCGDFYLSTRIIKGQYPDYQQVVPKEIKTELNIDKDQLVSALERCAVIASSSANIVKIEVLENQLLIRANTPDVGNVNELIDIQKNNDEKIQISLNVRLVLEALKIIKSSKINLSLIDALKPGIIKPVSNKDDSNFLYVIMPIRTSDHN
ncbi:DNA polymerase III subunit beta [Candidatus Margulisiibacteriota bacterium]